MLDHDFWIKILRKSLIGFRPVQYKNQKLFKYGHLLNFSGISPIGSHTPYYMLVNTKESLSNTHALFGRKVQLNEIFSCNIRLEQDCYLKEIQKLANKNKVTLIQQKSSELNVDRNIDKIWESISSRARNEIRKSEANGIYCQLIKGSTFRNEILDLIMKTKKRKQFSSNFKARMLTEILNYNDGKKIILIGAFHQKLLVNFSIFVVDQNTAFYFQGATEGKYLSQGSSTASMWAGITRLHEISVTKLDLNGLGDHGVRKWKQSFKGNEFSWFRAVKTNKLFKHLLLKKFK